MTTMLSNRPAIGERTLRAKPGESLTLDEMRARLPAIFAPEAHSSRSQRYVYISTHDVVEQLVARDFVPVEARMSRVKDAGRDGYQKHMMRFQARQDLVPTQRTDRRVGDTSFEVILRNAHDGTGSYQFMAGLLRLICLNGCVVSDGQVADVKVLHSGGRQKQLDAVAEGAFRILEQGPRVIETVKQWKDIELTADDQTAYAEAARTLRFGDSEGEVKTPITAQQLLGARRYDDKGGDLWSTFNRVQENVIRGGLTGMGRDTQNRLRRTTTREVRGIDGDVKLNKALWQLAQAMAEHKAG
jgi:hypothetical protein